MVPLVQRSCHGFHHAEAGKVCCDTNNGLGIVGAEISGLERLECGNL